jgi:hypothetical protein
MDKCPFCGAGVLQDTPYYDCWVSIEAPILRTNKCLESELTALKERLAKAEDLFDRVLLIADCNWRTDKIIPDIKAFLSHTPSALFKTEKLGEPFATILHENLDDLLIKDTVHIPSDYVTVNLNDYACLQVLKTSMPPNSSLVICYDDGNGVPHIQDEMYEDYVVVEREDVDWAEAVVRAKANEIDSPSAHELADRLKAALNQGQEIPEPEAKP